MDAPTRPHRPPAWPAHAAFWSLMVIISAINMGLFLRIGFDLYEPAMFLDMVRGSAHRPFVHRTLVPSIIHWIHELIPRGLRLSWDRALMETPWVMAVFRNYRWNAQFPAVHVIGLAVVYATMWAVPLCLRALLRSLYVVPRGFERAAVLFIFAGLPSCFRYNVFIYDFATLALFALGLTMMVRRRWVFYLLVHLLACLNKETAALLTVIFAIHFARRLPPRVFWGLLGAQVVSQAVIVAYTLVRFRLNPGAPLEFHLFDHNLTHLPTLRFSDTLVAVAVALGLAHDWHAKPRLMRDALWAAPPLLLMSLICGYIDEWRSFWELGPAVLMLLIPPVAKLAQVELTIRPEACVRDRP